MDRKGAGVTGLLLVGLLMLGTACGGGSDKEASTSDGKVTATTAASSNSDGGSSGSDNGSGSVDAADMSEFLDSDCQAAVVAYSSIFTSAMGGSSLLDDAQRQELEDNISDLASKVPSELEDDIATISAAYQEYFEALGDLDLSELSNLGKAGDLEKAGGKIDSAEVTEAQQNLEDFFKENCPSMSGLLG